jgi:hypothetical protein
MTIPPQPLSGTNDNRLGIQVQFIYDSQNSGFRAVTDSDLLSATSGVATLATGSFSFNVTGINSGVVKNNIFY